MTSLQALLRKAFRSPGVLVLGDFGIFCLFLPRASREVKINRKCLTCLPKLGSSLLGTTAILGSSMKLHHNNIISFRLMTINTFNFNPTINSFHSEINAFQSLLIFTFLQVSLVSAKFGPQFRAGQKSRSSNNVINRGINKINDCNQINTNCLRF